MKNLLETIRNYVFYAILLILLALRIACPIMNIVCLAKLILSALGVVMKQSTSYYGVSFIFVFLLSIVVTKVSKVIASAIEDCVGVNKNGR